MYSEKQAGALRLADELDKLDGKLYAWRSHHAAKELRRLHAENEALKAAPSTSQPLTQKPIFWYRPTCGGEMYKGPVHDSSIGGKMMRDEKPGEWLPLFDGTTAPSTSSADPIYQYQLANGNWIDQPKESYDYNVKHGQATVRVVYLAAPSTSQTKQVLEKFDELAALKAAPSTSPAFLDQFSADPTQQWPGWMKDLAVEKTASFPKSNQACTSPIRLTVKQRVDIADVCANMDWDNDYINCIGTVIDLIEVVQDIKGGE